MKPEDYFPRPTRKPGVEPFEPPFTNGINQESLKEGEAWRVCPKCGKSMEIIKAVGSDKSHGHCPKCGAEAKADVRAYRKELERGKK